MKVYIASFFDTRERLRPMRDALWKMGHEVVSTWLDEVAKPAHMPRDEFWRKLALKDLAEVKSADMLILDTIDQSPRGGREVEYGFALGAFAGKTTMIVGPVRNVFHELADYQAEDWQDALEFMEELKPSPKDQPEPNSTPNSGMWHVWAGGVMPVKDGSSVLVELRNGYKSESPSSARGLMWEHRGSGGDIVKYKLVDL